MRSIKSTLKYLRSYSPFTMVIAIIVSFVTHVGVVRAQELEQRQDALEAQQSESASIYGGNPYEDEEEERQEQGGRGGKGKKEGEDSAKVRIIKPLESYFFSDSTRAQNNFKWNVNPNYNRVSLQQIDTTLNNWRIDYPFYQEGVGDMALGGLGQASQAIDYSDRANYYDFSFAQPFDAYIYTVDNAPFYNVKKPMIRMKYLESGQKNYRESNFSIMHAQNMSPSSGFAVEYQANSTKGLYQQQDTKNHNLAVTAYHTGRRYSVHGGYLNNTIKTEENGGVVGLWTVRDSTFEMPIGIPTKLGEASASNHYRNNTLFVEQAFGVPMEEFGENDFSLADKTAFYVGHSMAYSTWSRVYRDTRATYTDDRAWKENGVFYSETGEYYENWFFDADKTQDSIRERAFTNKLFIQAQPWGREAVVGTVDGGIGIDMNVYQQFGLSGYITGKYDRDIRTSWYAYGSASGQYRRYFDWNGEFKIYPSGYRAGDMSLKGNIDLKAYIKNKPLTLSGSFLSEIRSPSYWEENLISNHFVFTTPLSKESETRLGAELKIPAINFELGVNTSIVSDMIYYDTDANVAQANDVVSLTSAYLRKKFVIGGLNFDHRILGQWSTDQVVAPVPDLSAFLSYYYEFWVVKNVLRVQAGLDGRYTTSYYMPGYNPAISAFFNQRDESIGDYPYIDAFVAAKWKRMRILVKYQHVNNGWIGNGEYFQVANYPLNPGMFKFGISWGFYD